MGPTFKGQAIQEIIAGGTTTQRNVVCSSGKQILGRYLTLYRRSVSVLCKDSVRTAL
jgi:hypothetical protein